MVFFLLFSNLGISANDVDGGRVGLVSGDGCMAFLWQLVLVNSFVYTHTRAHCINGLVTSVQKRGSNEGIFIN